jgi:mannose-6-phosphate isomerase-like protein (cupin superfamily)
MSEFGKTIKAWGYYTIVDDVNENVKVKHLHVEPGQSLSLQRHFKRNELWFIAEGQASLEIINSENKSEIKLYQQYDQIQIPVNSWHRLFNISRKALKVIEIQYGDKCIEEDIERK